MAPYTWARRGSPVKKLYLGLVMSGTLQMGTMSDLEFPRFPSKETLPRTCNEWHPTHGHNVRSWSPRKVPQGLVISGTLEMIAMSDLESPRFTSKETLPRTCDEWHPIVRHNVRS